MAKKWVAHLRSEKYKQNFGSWTSNRGDGAMCPMALLNDLAHKRAKPIGRGPIGIQVEVLEWAGMKSGSADKIINLNDRKKLPKEKIAKFIERNYRAL